MAHAITAQDVPWQGLAVGTYPHRWTDAPVARLVSYGAGRAGTVVPLSAP